MADHVPVGVACLKAGMATYNGVPPGAIPAALDTLAEALSASHDSIVSTASEESGLTREELAPEFARMVGTLRMFAALVREGSWVRAAIDTPATMSIGPGHDVRSMLTPLGPVAVFGASNFPLAYGVCGGDTASALAAGCPVVVKEHPAHPKTGRLLASIAQAALPGSGLENFLHYLHNEDPADHSVAAQLVGNPCIAAVGFTGSRQGGLAVESLARNRTAPIPVFAEMGSANLVCVLPAAATARAEQIADQLADSLLVRVGQQCTAPTVILAVSGDACERLARRLAQRMHEWSPRRMLSRRVLEEYVRSLHGAHRRFTAPGAEPVTRSTPERLPGAFVAGPDVLSLKAEPALLRDALPPRETNGIDIPEIFGPGVVLVESPSAPHMLQAMLGSRITPCLVTSLYFEQSESTAAASMIRALQQFSGRVVLNGPTTGVRVCDAMVHGGPFPATNRPDTTAVGPRAIERWCRPVCFQNCPDALLPPELQNANPRGILRTLNGSLTRDPVHL